MLGVQIHPTVIRPIVRTRYLGARVEHNTLGIIFPQLLEDSAEMLGIGIFHESAMIGPRRIVAPLLCLVGVVGDHLIPAPEVSTPLEIQSFERPVLLL